MISTVTRIYSDNNILTGSAGSLVSSISQVRKFGVDGDFVEMDTLF